MKITLIVLALAGACIGAPTEPKSYKDSAYTAGSEYKDNLSMAVPVYTFDYGVKNEATGVDLGHSESRDKDDIKGKYYVTLPDGRQQVVKYIVDGDLGYIATIEYYGEAKYTTDYVRDIKKPENDLQVWPQYQPPKPKPEYKYHKYKQPEPGNRTPYEKKEQTTTTTTTSTTEKYTTKYVQPIRQPESAPVPEIKSVEESEVYAALENMKSVTLTLFRDDVGPILAKNRDHQPRPVMDW